MSLSCPLCFAFLTSGGLESHVRWELGLPLAKCRLCPQHFCAPHDAEEHFSGPLAVHPGEEAAFLQPPSEPAAKARLAELLRLARARPEAVERRLCVCGHCRLACREDSLRTSPVSTGDLRPATAEHYKDPSAAAQETQEVSDAEGGLGQVIERMLTEESDQRPFTLPPLKDEYPAASEQHCSSENNAIQQTNNLQTQLLAIPMADPQNFAEENQSDRNEAIPGPIEFSNSLEPSFVESIDDSIQAEATADETDLNISGNNFDRATNNAFSHRSLDGTGNAHSKRSACSQCGKVVDGASFANHVRSDHIAKDSFRCLLCPFTSYKRSKLADHQRRIHKVEPGEGTFREAAATEQVAQWVKLCFGATKQRYTMLDCKACGKRVRSQDVKSHTATVHLKRAMFACKLCGYATNDYTVGRINKHVRIVHKSKPTGEQVDRLGVEKHAAELETLTRMLFKTD